MGCGGEGVEGKGRGERGRDGGGEVVWKVGNGGGKEVVVAEHEKVREGVGKEQE